MWPMSMCVISVWCMSMCGICVAHEYVCNLCVIMYGVYRVACGTRHGNVCVYYCRISIEKFESVRGGMTWGRAVMVIGM